MASDNTLPTKSNFQEGLEAVVKEQGEPIQLTPAVLNRPFYLRYEAIAPEAPDLQYGMCRFLHTSDQKKLNPLFTENELKLLKIVERQLDAYREKLDDLHHGLPFPTNVTNMRFAFSPQLNIQALANDSYDAKKKFRELYVVDIIHPNIYEQIEERNAFIMANNVIDEKYRRGVEFPYDPKVKGNGFDALRENFEKIGKKVTLKVDPEENLEDYFARRSTVTVYQQPHGWLKRWKPKEDKQLLQIHALSVDERYVESTFSRLFNKTD